MPAAYSTMTLGDGVITADLVDGVNYQLLLRSYAPTLAGRRRINMSGRSPYVKVVESITIWVRGTDGATCLANMAQLAQLLDQAERFAAGDEVNPVLYTIQPQGSILTAALQAKVYGRPPGSTSGIDMPINYNEHLKLFEIGPVKIQFVRDGPLIGAAEAAVGAATAAPNPTIREATFISSHAIPSPIRLEITGWNETEHFTIESPSVLFVTAAKEDIYLLEAEVMTNTGFTSVTDAGNNPSGGNVLRYTATTTDEKPSGSHIIAASFDRDTEEIAIYAMIRGHATKDFLLWGESASYTFTSADRTRDPFVVSAGDYITPTPVHLGSLIQRRGHNLFRLIAQALDNTGSPTIDIDYIVLVALKSTTYIYQLGAMQPAAIVDTSPSSISIVIDPQPLTDRSPFVGYTESADGNEADVSVKGDGSLYMSGQKIASLWMGRRGTSWVDTGIGNVTQVGMVATRSRAYLAPQ